MDKDRRIQNFRDFLKYLGIISFVFFCLLAPFIYLAVRWAGAGDDFWSVDIVQFTTGCLIVSIICRIVHNAMKPKNSN